MSTMALPSSHVLLFPAEHRTWHPTQLVCSCVTLSVLFYSRRVWVAAVPSVPWRAPMGHEVFAPWLRCPPSCELQHQALYLSVNCGLLQPPLPPDRSIPHKPGHSMCCFIYGDGWMDPLDKPKLCLGVWPGFDRETVLCLKVNSSIISVGYTDTIYADHRQNDT